MRSPLNQLPRASRANSCHRLEGLERRVLMAAAPSMLQPPPGTTLLDPFTVPQFVNNITPAGSFFDDFRYDIVNNHVTVGAYQINDSDLGLGRDPVTNAPRLTDLFGYGTSAGTASYPGRSFVVRENTSSVADTGIAVTWVNGLPDKHVVNIDPTLLDGARAGYPAPRLVYDAENNSIPGGIPAVPHLHGGHTDAVYDGTPMQWWNRLEAGSASVGQDYIDTRGYGNPKQPANTFTYRNDQQAATLWYHDHAMGVTRLNAYAGMAGFYIIRGGIDTGIPDDPKTKKIENPLPAGRFEVGLAIQDKQFLSDGRLWFPAMAQTWNGTDNVASTLPEMFGDTILVNGKAWPKMDVEPRRYRFRFLNGSDSAFYSMTIATPANARPALPFWQIGTDDGLLNTAVRLPTLTVAPGERADVIIDFTQFKPGTRFIVRNSGATPFPNGARPLAGLTDRIMMFNVVAPRADSPPDTTTPPALLTGINPTVVPPTQADLLVQPTHEIALYETLDGMGRVTPLMGTPSSSMEFLDPITEMPPRGQPVVWRIYNNTVDAHPIHLHQVSYQVVARQRFSSKLVPGAVVNGTQMWGMDLKTLKFRAPTLTKGADAGWKDTIQILPGEAITLRATFDLPGKYVTHCHILSHEEHDMMRFLQVGDEAYPPPGFVVDNKGREAEPVIRVMPVDSDGGHTHIGTVLSAVTIAPVPKGKEKLAITRQVLA